jgi:hypothetical protein
MSHDNATHINIMPYLDYARELVSARDDRPVEPHLVAEQVLADMPLYYYASRQVVRQFLIRNLNDRIAEQ